MCLLCGDVTSSFACSEELAEAPMLNMELRSLTIVNHFASVEDYDFSLCFTMSFSVS